jgi:hypothetical protein
MQPGDLIKNRRNPFAPLHRVLRVWPDGLPLVRRLSTGEEKTLTRPEYYRVVIANANHTRTHHHPRPQQPKPKAR